MSSLHGTSLTRREDPASCLFKLRSRVTVPSNRFHPFTQDAKSWHGTQKPAASSATSLGGAAGALEELPQVVALGALEVPRLVPDVLARVRGVLQMDVVGGRGSFSGCALVGAPHCLEIPLTVAQLADVLRALHAVLVHLRCRRPHVVVRRTRRGGRILLHGKGLVVDAGGQVRREGESSRLVVADLAEELLLVDPINDGGAGV
eukprot:CAMPEP_0180204062 /NCGR_PEP_ID=MMETSP0987-20121128/8205_1 /TAXON_ID=697907 /ORGANISM="non described non described, Strain CCMP2293" /LENGTH=203 /DNA_ID=CAMNT_0022159515 /DNA_START=22 /DNA_END=632 /DNA_ORIENTATION=+